MAEGNQLARPLGRHDPGDLRAGEGITLGQLPQALDRLRRHANGGCRDRPSPLVRLPTDVDHVHAAGVVEMRELAAHGVVFIDNARRPATAVTRRS